MEILYLVSLGLLIIALLALSSIFSKAGQSPFTVFVPIYNHIVLLRIVGKPWWWIFLLFIPIVNVFGYFYVYQYLCLSFNVDKDVPFTLGLLTLPFIFFPILALSGSYYGPARWLPGKGAVSFEHYSECDDGGNLNHGRMNMARVIDNGGRARVNQGSVGAGIFWMFLISLLLFWLPVVGPLIAGIVGGKKSGSLGAAITAVFLPSIVFGAILFVAGASLTGLPIIGALAGAGGLVLGLSHVGPLLLGAVIGGLMA